MSVLSKIKGLALMTVGAAAGVTAYHFLDPDRGRGRRTQTADQLAARARERTRELRQRIDYRAGEVKGVMAERVGRLRPAEPLNDQTLKHKVESEVFGSGRFPKGSIVVDAYEGTVALRGQVETLEQRNALVEAVREVEGVSEVEDLLHLPGEPAPNVQPARDAGSQPS
ncbi:MAG: BON domain-containing protein [Actinomycetota bacterium]|nr:BON domain-containing protein [Actinomycetota bacterium]